MLHLGHAYSLCPLPWEEESCLRLIATEFGVVLQGAVPQAQAVLFISGGLQDQGVIGLRLRRRLCCVECAEDSIVIDTQDDTGWSLRKPEQAGECMPASATSGWL